MPRNLLQAMVAFSGDPCVIADRQGLVKAANAAAGRTYGLHHGVTLWQFVAEDARIASDFALCFQRSTPHLMEVTFRTGGRIGAVGWRIGGPLRAEGLIGLRFSENAGQRSAFLDLNDRLDANQRRLWHLAAAHKALETDNAALLAEVGQDPMTGLLNPSGFALEQARLIGGGQPHALLYLDMNGLKSVNDRFGHPAGNAIITHMADVLRGQLRQSDIAARLGGDEFAVLLTGNGTARGVIAWTQRFLADLAAPVLLPQAGGRKPLELSVSAAVGAAFYPADGLTAAELEAEADAAMYRSKTSGEPVCFSRGEGRRRSG